MKKALLLVLSISMILSSCKSSKYPDLGDGVFADIQTTKGDIVVKLEYEKVPVTVANFISLAEGTNTFVAEEYKGKKFYDGLIFHRVMKDFMIQGGDPLGTGMGNQGYRFMDEFNDSLVHDRKGVLSMANSGANTNTNGSQFFITHKPTPWLDKIHSVFGEVVLGMPIVDSIANVAVAGRNRPVEEVKMNTIEIIRNGKEAKDFDAVAVMTDYFNKEGERLAALEAEKKAKMEAVKKIKETFVADLASQKAKAKAYPSGLKVLILEEGSGEKPGMGTKVLVDYAGFLEDGTLFDTSKASVADTYGMLDQLTQMHRGNLSPSPMDYSPDAQLAPGFREGLLTMKVGDKVRLFFPSHLGYGDRDYGPIPGGSSLVFDLEITGLAQ
ncbi:peptidylprolyl isomerase [Maribacter algarum]|uniref:peptidylprolyl isomerase n=1 Tax=Maribacter algarum (ex Zhang et al. 2020) TaxID=2578118 RepID=A0A5S3PHZ5_9FLAO|nr:peptidylprolyl isomerase [Maribacter algarum]TMM53867.1 peptidylprolyl isomerase [Maribacter algarum]